jgi:transposase
LVTQEHRPLAAIARDLGIGENVLRRWKQQFTADHENAFVGTGNLSSEQTELRRLQRENADLREERDILKKAISVFSDRKR